MRVASKETVKIEKVIERYRNPALMVSFGKDSLVLWHLLKHLNLPIIRHKTPWQPRRWFFGDRMIASNALTVYDWPPEATGMQHDEKMQAYELVSLYTIGSGKVLGIRQKIEDVGNVDGENVCGLHDCLRRPIGTISHAWDL